MSPDDVLEFFDESGLLRRVHSSQVVLDKNSGKYRPSSAAFNDNNLSVDIETILTSRNFDWTFTLKGHEGFSLVRFSAEIARDLGQKVILCEIPGNPAHGEVRGKKTGAVKGKLVEQSEWVHLSTVHLS